MSEYDTRVSNFASVIPNDLRAFEKEDIRRAFVYMEKTFHLHKDWYNQHRQEQLDRRAGMSEVEYFFRFALKNLDPPLKTILRRRESVILPLCRYIIKDKVKTKPKATQQGRSYR